VAAAINGTWRQPNFEHFSMELATPATVAMRPLNCTGCCFTEGDASVRPALASQGGLSDEEATSFVVDMHAQGDAHGTECERHMVGTLKMAADVRGAAGLVIKWREGSESGPKGWADWTKVVGELV
jgi:hypothetical protein